MADHEILEKKHFFFQLHALKFFLISREDYCLKNGLPMIKFQLKWNVSQSEELSSFEFMVIHYILPSSYHVAL